VPGETRAVIRTLCFRPRCGRDSDDRPSIKSNTVSMNTRAAVVIRYAFA